MSSFTIRKAGPYSYFLFFLLTFNSHRSVTADISFNTIFVRVYLNDSETFNDISMSDIDNLVDIIDIEKIIMFYVHGFTESVNSTSVITVVKAYCNHSDYNVMAVDWSMFAGQNYLQAALSIQPVGKFIANALNNIFDRGIETEKFHMVTHSLGSHLGGIIGRNLENTIPLIVALDPAGPLFELLAINNPLRSSDATNVQVIHTDSTVYGNINQMGTVDFWPNSGIRIQPGCPLFSVPLSKNDFCSHHRSWAFFAESVWNSKAFSAVPCSDMNRQLGKPILMGFGTPFNARGNYYLITGSMSPFGLGSAGAECCKTH